MCGQRENELRNTTEAQVEYLCQQNDLNERAIHFAIDLGSAFQHKKTQSLKFKRRDHLLNHRVLLVILCFCSSVLNFVKIVAFDSKKCQRFNCLASIFTFNNSYVRWKPSERSRMVFEQTHVFVKGANEFLPNALRRLSRFIELTTLDLE